MRSVLADVVYMMVGPGSADSAAPPSPEMQEPSQASLFWARLSRKALSGKRKTLLMEGNCLLQCERRGMSQGDEQLIICVFLREPTWVPLFPELARRCSALTASRLRSQLVSSPDASSGGPWRPAGRLGSLAEEDEADRSTPVAAPFGIHSKPSTMGEAVRRSAAGAAQRVGNQPPQDVQFGAARQQDILPPPPGLEQEDPYSVGYSHPSQHGQDPHGQRMLNV